MILCAIITCRRCILPLLEYMPLCECGISHCDSDLQPGQHLHSFSVAHLAERGSLQRETAVSQYAAPTKHRHSHKCLCRHAHMVAGWVACPPTPQTYTCMLKHAHNILFLTTHLRATCLAVCMWSPVTIRTSMPAARQANTAPGTSGRSGSCVGCVGVRVWGAVMVMSGLRRQVFQIGCRTFRTCFMRQRQGPEGVSRCGAVIHFTMMPNSGI